MASQNPAYRDRLNRKRTRPDEARDRRGFTPATVQRREGRMLVREALRECQREGKLSYTFAGIEYLT